MNWYIECLKKYAQFSGRARRKEYWFFQLFNFLISIGLALLDGVMGTLDPEVGMGLLGGIYVLAVLIPNLAVTFRRLHDAGKSAWSLLLFLIPLVGPIVILVFLVQSSQEGHNDYGPNPIDDEGDDPEAIEA